MEPTRLLRPWDFAGKSARVGCHFLLQGIFLTQGSNLGVPYCRQTLYRLSHQGSPPKKVETEVNHTYHQRNALPLRLLMRWTGSVYFLVEPCLDLVSVVVRFR